MKIAISKIKIAARIRKEVRDIAELAANIREHGLISPVAVMPCSTSENGEEYQLLAGLRRIRAMELNGETEIDAKVFPASDAEAALKIEYSENEQRAPFTYSEKMDYARLIEEIETAKAKERMSLGGKGGIAQGTDLGPDLEKKERRDVIGEKIGMSGKQYDRAKYIAKNAPPEIIEQLDNGERTIRGTYDELRAKEAAENTPPLPFEISTRHEEPETQEHESAPTAKPTPPPFTPPKTPRTPKLSDKEKEERAMAALSPAEREAVERINAFSAMTPDEKIAELQAQLKAERCRASIAETELSRLKDDLHNAVMHRDGIIKSMQKQLDSAHARIAELEESKGDSNDCT